MATTSPLYPPLEPYATGFLNVDSIHTLYFEQSGNPNGVPVVFLHGGPGAGSNAKHRQFFDPRHYRIIVFDQRGAGRSTPLGELRNNTTTHLIADIEQLRGHFNISRWHVFGGSWGSTLAIAYAAAHPARVLSLTLRGIFLMTDPEIDWFLHGMGHFFPEAAERFTGLLSVEERQDILQSYYMRLTSADRAVALEAARAWSGYEGACVRLIPEPVETSPTDKDDNAAFAIARMECHYFIHSRFMPDDYLLRAVDLIRHIPAVIVQGRYDIVCPPVTAFALAQRWPEAKTVFVPDAGHSSSEPGIAAALVQATNSFRNISS